MARESRFPGFRRLQGRAERFEELATGEVLSRRQVERLRGSPLPSRPGRARTETKLPGGYKQHDAWKSGRELHSTKELRRFIEKSKADCFYDDFLLGGKTHPTTQHPERPPGSQRYPKFEDESAGPVAVRIPMRQRYESRAMDKQMLLKTLDESRTLLDFAQKMRPDIPMTGAHVYGWTMREGACS